MNEVLVEEQVKMWERAGAWRNRRVSALKTPLTLMYNDGPRVVEDGMVNGLVHVHTIKGTVKVYADIRDGHSIAVASSPHSKLVEAMLGASMDELAGHPHCTVVWCPYEFYPYLIYGATIQEVVAKAKGIRHGDALKYQQGEQHAQQ